MGETKIADEYMGLSWFDYHDISDMIYLTDALESAIEIGDELLRNLI